MPPDFDGDLLIILKMAEHGCTTCMNSKVTYTANSKGQIVGDVDFDTTDRWVYNFIKCCYNTSPRKGWGLIDYDNFSIC